MLLPSPLLSLFPHCKHDRECHQPLICNFVQAQQTADVIKESELARRFELHCSKNHFKKCPKPRNRQSCGGASAPAWKPIPILINIRKTWMQIRGAVRLLCGHVYLNGQSVTRTLSTGRKEEILSAAQQAGGERYKLCVDTANNTINKSVRDNSCTETNGGGCSGERRSTWLLSPEKSAAVELFHRWQPIKLPLTPITFQQVTVAPSDECYMHDSNLSQLTFFMSYNYSNPINFLAFFYNARWNAVVTFSFQFLE